jgi:membrane protein DedA with SNARE-associated domain
VGYAFVFMALVLCGFGLPIPEDVALLTGGVLAWLSSDVEVATFSSMVHDQGLVTMVGVGLAGILAGDSIIYWAGRRYGSRVAEFAPLRRLITPHKMEIVERKIRRRGYMMVLFARFLPGLRAPTFFTVGHAGMPYWEFVAFDGTASLVSAPVWVCLGFWFGDDLQAAAHAAGRFSHYILLGVGVALLAIFARWLQGRRGASESSGREPP